MNVLIVYAHPYEKSFNHGILRRVEKTLKCKKVNFQVIDLYKDNFNPAYTAKELSLFKEGKTTDPNVQKYQQLLKKTDKMVFIFPIWWNDIPAIIKGFIDKVMKKQFAYKVGATGVVGNLKNIKQVVMTTSTSPTWYLKIFCGNAIKSVFIKSTLSQLGMKNITWINFGNIDKSSENSRQNHLKIISKKIKTLANKEKDDQF